MDSSSSRDFESQLETIRAEAMRSGMRPARTASGTVDRESVPREKIEGRYDLLKQIGTGGMGMVYLAHDAKLDRHVAIKRLVVKSYNARTVQRRFLREAQTIAVLGHFNIVNVYDIGQDEKGHYIIMEYVPGPNLSSKVKPVDPAMPVNLHGYVSGQGPMGSDAATELIIKVGNALSYAHNRGIIHRDIKPTNILINPDYEPKLVDFGLARPINLAKSEEITLAGSILGTPEYCAPEQWGDATKVDARADVYALGGVFWFALSGRSPRYFRESDVDDHLGPILAKALAAKPENRYQNINELITDLEDEPAEVHPAPEASSIDVSVTQGFWICPHCEQSSPDSAKYCIHCGTSGLDSCPNCGTLYRVGLQHCPGCGVDVKMLEESATLLSTAKNHASFCEYETALDYLNEEVRNSNPEARQLYKEWRDQILRRRNLMMDLDTALRVFNVEKAIDLAVELKQLVPEECLSESADFKSASDFAAMLEELKQMLIEAANRARQDFSLAKFGQNIRFLNQVFGDDVCHVINQDLALVERELDDALTRAGLAAGMNCFTHAQEVLSTTDPWKGGDLGNRRQRLSTTCKDLIEKREHLIEDAEKAVRESRFSEALVLVKQMLRFRLPPNNSEITPAEGDREAQDRIIRIDKALTAAIEEHINDWVRRDEWENLVNALAALKGAESSAWRKLSERLRTMGNQEIVKRYNYAIELEKKGRFNKAEKAWADFLRIPQELTPSNLWQYAKEYQMRSQVYRRQRATVVFRRWLMALTALWLYFLIDEGRRLAGGDAAGIDVHQRLLQAAPAVIALLLSLIVAIYARTKSFRKLESRFTAIGISPRLTVTALLVALSPLAYLTVAASEWLLLPQLPEHVLLDGYVMAGVVLLGIDLFKRDRLRLPGRFALTLSWILLAAAMLVLPLPELGHTLQAGVLILTHGLLMLLILLAHRLWRREGQEQLPRPKTEQPTEQEANA